MIHIQNLVKTFYAGDTELIALKHLSFDIPSGQFIAITGRSGSGKSTLLYQISLLDRPTDGMITINEQDVLGITNGERVKYRRDNFGFIFQDYALLPMLTAEENVIVPMLMQNIEKEKATKLAQDALMRVGLSNKFRNLPSQLSGGQQQRVSIARAIAHNPKILFADEPTANLDTESSGEVLNIFLKLHQSGQTIIMVTHEQEYAQLAQRIIELLDGTIVRDELLESRKKKRQS